MLRTRAFYPALLLALTAAACGSKTGLDAPDVDAGMDVQDAADVPDVTDVQDVPRPRRPAACYPLRIHTRIGLQVNLEPDVVGVSNFDTGYVWNLVSQPDGASAQLFNDPSGSSHANITPVVAGPYEITVLVPTDDDAGTLPPCHITVIADPPDPRCPGYAIAEPRSVAIPSGDVQVAFDVVWSPPRTSSSGGVGIVASEDTDARVSAAVVEQATAEDLSSPATALAQIGSANEQAVETALNGTPVFIGNASTTHDGFLLRRSTIRVDTANATTPDVLRDQAARAVANIAPPALDPFEVHAPAAAFYVEIATMLRTDTRHVVTTLAVSPVASFDDPTQVTAIRVNDMANATAIARTDAMLSVLCREITATRVLQADFLWLVDTSGSMDDKQQKVGDTAAQFFDSLNSAGVDFRVGVMQAGHSRPVLTGTTGHPEPFKWIHGTDADGPQQMAFQVTTAQYNGDSRDNEEPFPMDGDQEEPVAASIEAIKEFERQRSIGSTNPDFVLRPDAAHVVFFITDESGTNDYDRYFAGMSSTWGSDISQIIPNVDNFFATRNITPFGMVLTYWGDPCPDVANMRACIITGGGGSYIPINVSGDETARQLNSAMNRVVDAVAGAASEFVLGMDIPISASLRAKVDRRIVPRSRSDGFDYAERSNALVFRGPSYRPAIGQEVRVAYFVWE